MATRSEVKAFLLEHLSEQLAAAGVSDPSDELQLIDTGVIDSFGFLALVTAAEATFGIQLDVSQVDLGRLATIGGFAEIVSEAG
jgi:acyl carrier protein